MQVLSDCSQVKHHTVLLSYENHVKNLQRDYPPSGKNIQPLILNDQCSILKSNYPFKNTYPDLINLRKGEKQFHLKVISLFVSGHENLLKFENTFKDEAMQVLNYEHFNIFYANEYHLLAFLISRNFKNGIELVNHFSSALNHLHC